MRRTGNPPGILGFQLSSRLLMATPESVALLAATCVVVASMVGCSVRGDKKSKETSAVKSTPATATSKDPSPIAQFLTLQDLSVREERGQTILLVKFSQSASQFRHFPLPSPARIVLDVFGNPNRAAQAESFRIDTSAVATLRVNPVEGGLRLATD